ncbi:MAG TPA: hypothetical protein VFG76_02360 [Candidatus Polarisedimenticolia bacterium]|nr:hypothetical protein [Candidatus Polarisedimenticolia bacterium]
MKTALVCVACLLALPLYVGTALTRSQSVNTNKDATDQSAYMNYAKRMEETNFHALGDRNRMPVYPFLLSVIHPDDMDDQQFFERGKLFNILLSIVSLAALLAIFLRRFPALGALDLTLVTAFSVFLFKASYVQVEILFYTLVFCAFLLMRRMIEKPGWGLALLTGGTLGLAHLTKAAVVPGLLIFLGIGLAVTLQRWRRMARGGGAKGPAAILLAGVVFLAVVSPYIINSKRVFGRYFYNVNTTFYMWYDTHQEMLHGTRDHGDRVGWPTMPPEEIPSMTRYVREHTVAQMAQRVAAGVKRMHVDAKKSFGYYKYLLLYAAGAVMLAAFNLRSVAEFARRNAGVVLFSCAYLAGYVFLYTWISAVHAGLNRITLQQFLPLLFTLACVIHSDLMERPSIQLGGRRLLARDAFNFVVLVVLLIDIAQVVTGRGLTMQGGV